MWFGSPPGRMAGRLNVAPTTNTEAMSGSLAVTHR